MIQFDLTGHNNHSLFFDATDDTGLIQSFVLPRESIVACVLQSDPVGNEYCKVITTLPESSDLDVFRATTESYRGICQTIKQTAVEA